MSTKPTPPAPPHEKKHSENLPGWAVPIIRVCQVLFPYLLAAGFLLLIALMVSIAASRTKQIDLSWTNKAIPIMSFLLSFGMLAALISHYKTVIAGWVILFLGVALNYSPLLLYHLAANMGFSSESEIFPVIDNICKTLHSDGIFGSIIAIMSLVTIYIFWFIDREARKRRLLLQYSDPNVKNIEKQSLVPKCWQLSRCRPSVRSGCPNYVNQVTCWKQRSGCFCDRDLADHLISSVGRGEAQEVIDMQKSSSMLHGSRSKHGKAAGTKKRPTWKIQKYRCHNCPVFNEHQEYKYRHFSWTSLPVTLLIAIAAWPLFERGYTISTLFLNHVLENYRLGSTELMNSSFEYVVYGVLLLLLWGYVIESMDTLFLKWKC